MHSTVMLTRSANFSSPMPGVDRFLPVVKQILSERERPINYRELAVSVLDRLAWPFDRTDVRNLAYFQEQIRQYAKRTTGILGYDTPQADGLTFLRAWFDKNDSRLFDRQAFQIDISERDRAETCDVVTLRADEIWNRVGRPTARQASHLLTRYLPEVTFRNYCKATWPSLVLDARNAHDPTRPAAEDLIIRTAWRDYLVDVATRNVNGTIGGYSKVVRGERADFHVLIDTTTYDAGVARSIDVIGWADAKMMRRGIVDARDARDFTRFRVWMNCLVAGIDTDRLRDGMQMSQGKRNEYRRLLGRLPPTPPVRAAGYVGPTLW